MGGLHAQLQLNGVLQRLFGGCAIPVAQATLAEPPDLNGSVDLQHGSAYQTFDSDRKSEDIITMLVHNTPIGNRT